MADWLSKVSGRLKGAFNSKKPLAEVLPEMIDPGDPRVVIRPLGDDWLCPFTGLRVMAPSWNGSSLTILKCPEIRDHLLAQPELQKQSSDAKMKSFEDLIGITLFMRVDKMQNYKYTADGGEWVCPYCMKKTQVLLKNWDGSETEIKWFLPEALKHFAACEDYQTDPLGGAHTSEEIKESGGDRAKILRLIAKEPRYRVCDAEGSWICPYGLRPITSINMKREAWAAPLHQKILLYVLSPSCPGNYSQYEIEKSLDEIKKAAATKIDRF
jgi:hypothetical protein